MASATEVRPSPRIALATPTLRRVGPPIWRLARLQARTISLGTAESARKGRPTTWSSSCRLTMTSADSWDLTHQPQPQGAPRFVRTTKGGVGRRQGEKADGRQEKTGEEAPDEGSEEHRKEPGGSAGKAGRIDQAKA